MALHVRREGYYNWLHRPSKETRGVELVSALQKARKIHPCYGVQSMIDELAEGEKVSYSKGYRVFDWIETYYNRKRRHTANAGNLAPLMKRDEWNRQRLAA